MNLANHEQFADEDAQQCAETNEGRVEHLLYDSSRVRGRKKERRRGMPRVKGTVRTFLRSVERRSRRSWITSDSAFLAARTAEIYFMKSTPHFSQVPPWRCSWAQEGHWYRKVAWQRVQKRAMSRTDVPHFGHGISARG